MIIHINGMPGVGKFTVAKLLAERINAHLIDNHLIIDLVLAICERGSAEYISMIKKIMDAILEQITETPDQIFIFTNALAKESAVDKERLEQISSFSETNKIPFVQILLECDLDENKRRVISENRQWKGKLTNVDELVGLHKNYSIYHPPTKFSLKIDTSELSANVVSENIFSYIEKNKLNLKVL